MINRKFGKIEIAGRRDSPSLQAGGLMFDAQDLPTCQS